MFSAKDLVFAKGPAGGYTIAKSLRFRSSASAYLSRTPGTTGDRQKFTWSGWVKRGALSTSAFQALFGVYNSGTTDSDWFVISYIGTGGTPADAINISGWNTTYIRSNAIFRDTSAWYHIVVAVDTTSATSTITGTSTDRVRLYVNGVQVTAFNTANAPTQNLNTPVNYTVNQHRLGSINYSTGYQYFDGYLSEVNFIDGQALTPSDFGQTDTATGVWMPKAYTGTYGTNGFYLQFTDVGATSGSNTGYGKDFSGNSNYWTTNNLSSTAGVTYDSMVDTPTNYDNGGNGAGNYCVMNPLMSAATLAEANLKLTATAASWVNAAGTMFVSSGKWYWEATIVSAPYAMIGVATNAASTTANYATATTTWTYLSDGTKYGNGATATAYGASFTTNDVIGVALDMDSGTLTFYKNNVSQGTAFSTGLSGLVIAPWIGAFNSGCGAYANFGQRPFTYTPPSGFKALCTQNLPTPTIGATSSTLANKYFDISLYTGNGTSQTVTNAGGFQPDFVWFKSRNNAASHVVFDAVRGANQGIYPNVTNAEGTWSGQAFTSNGFTVNATFSGEDNTNGNTMVGWQWKANGSGSSNTSGSITSTVSANVTAGFSVVTYTGTGANATVGHGLGVAPKMVIVKQRGGPTNWVVYNSNLTSAAYYLSLNQTIASTLAATVWNSTAPDNTKFNIGTDNSVNSSTGTYVAYCFAEVAGYSKFGSYTGNGSADGPFVYCGFRPRYVLIKSSSAAGEGWNIFDTSRDTYNPELRLLFPNTADAEFNSGSTWADITANGFKIRYNASPFNTSTATYIFAAFAESPFNYARAR